MDPKQAVINLLTNVMQELSDVASLCLSNGEPELATDALNKRSMVGYLLKDVDKSALTRTITYKGEFEPSKLTESELLALLKARKDK